MKNQKNFFALLAFLIGVATALTSFAFKPKSTVTFYEFDPNAQTCAVTGCVVDGSEPCSLATYRAMANESQCINPIPLEKP